MPRRRILLHTAFLLALPLLVAWFGISVAGAAALVLFALLWRWAITLGALAAPGRIPEWELETIAASHFVEKVRWCMDRLGLNYTEKRVGATLGAFFLGRTVPLLRFRSGAVCSSIGNSAEILRYLWGSQVAEHPEGAEFLRPTPERLELERRTDRAGRDLQVWIYHHILDDRALTLHAWGADDPALPRWQHLALRTLFPLLRALIRRAFAITPERHAQAVKRISALLADVDTGLADGRKSILGGDTINYTDIAFAAVMALWVQPAEFGRGMADGVRIDLASCPGAMQDEISAWRDACPRATRFVEDMYREHRNCPP
ncbi:MAG: glutathione S-transferase family protein [Lysobacterales bacterium]|jgi:glutathione S-transferase